MKRIIILSLIIGALIGLVGGYILWANILPPPCVMP